jgi:hypothetical protein
MADRPKIPNYTGRKTFDFILSQVENCIIDIGPFFLDLNAERLYAPEYLEKCRIYLYERPEIDLVEMARCDIAYAIVFFGVSYYDLSGLIRLYSRKYNAVFISTLFFYISFKPHQDSKFAKEWDSFNQENLRGVLDDLIVSLASLRNVTEGYTKNPITIMLERLEKHHLNDEHYFKYYGGHQFKLGHYYRHLYQTVKYVDDQHDMKYKEKYELLKTLRAQLSTPEQYLLFFNTISLLGRAWEFDRIDSKIKWKNANCYLVTKYNFIKNIPDNYFINSIDIKHYYPLVHFEFDEMTEDRKVLERKFT